jgi:hypothetical protein
MLIQLLDPLLILLKLQLKTYHIIFMLIQLFDLLFNFLKTIAEDLPYNCYFDSVLDPLLILLSLKRSLGFFCRVVLLV